jgi:hypothetical protein
MKSYMGSGGLTELIRKYEAKWKLAVRITSRPLYYQTRMAAPNKYEAGWAPAALWVFWRREKVLLRAGIQRADRPTCSLVVKRYHPNMKGIRDARWQFL